MMLLSLDGELVGRAPVAGRLAEGDGNLQRVTQIVPSRDGEWVARVHGLDDRVDAGHHHLAGVAPSLGITTSVPGRSRFERPFDLSQIGAFPGVVSRLEQPQSEAGVVAVGNHAVRADHLDSPVVGPFKAAVGLDAVAELDVPSQPAVPPLSALRSPPRALRAGHSRRSRSRSRPETCRRTSG